MLSVSVGGEIIRSGFEPDDPAWDTSALLTGSVGRERGFPLSLLKGYNMGGESQAQSSDFSISQAAQADGRRKIIGRCRDRLERPLERCVKFSSPGVANTGVIIRRDMTLAAFHGRYYQTW